MKTATREMTLKVPFEPSIEMSAGRNEELGIGAPGVSTCVLRPFTEGQEAVEFTLKGEWAIFDGPHADSDGWYRLELRRFA